MLSTLLTVLKVVLLSRRPTRSQASPGADTLIVMGNGPSLRHTIDDDLEMLMRYDRMAVNFAANSDEYKRLRPNHYILADPHFFTNLNAEDKDKNVKRLWDNIRTTDWEMALHVPAKHRSVIGEMELPENISISYYNLTPGEGLPMITYPLFSAGLAMPRPRNVMIPAIMEAIRAGYRRIVLVGADHTWHQSLWVDDENRVVSVQPHFYKDKSDELDRVAKEYAGYKLHDILSSLTIAFRSYHQIKGYAAKRGVEVINATPGSMIDAFPRGSLRT